MKTTEDTMRVIVTGVEREDGDGVCPVLLGIAEHVAEDFAMCVESEDLEFEKALVYVDALDTLSSNERNETAFEMLQGILGKSGWTDTAREMKLVDACAEVYDGAYGDFMNGLLDSDDVDMFLTEITLREAFKKEKETMERRLLLN
ncbi:hypothetical protein [Aminicella lysinilytica]|uniref:Uncharacterized protein n=1 Tax=Aminicella lysinilytica TaxID=433323 RepID=A0A4R6Q0R5_9FIRM|nr:hypothetical protein [Aminicella lysinilytica]TDP53696.1 hypothetical protein EV211_12311 [Aminicella lysinilytica]